jgi:hypothetical protein
MVIHELQLLRQNMYITHISYGVSMDCIYLRKNMYITL